jgi:tetratricopeptide (TPR) repeat protein
MTFLELEKKCRQRKIKKLVLYLGLFFIFAAAVFLVVKNYYTASNKPKNMPETKKPAVKTHKPVQAPKKANSVTYKKPVAKEKKINLILDLNITEPVKQQKENNQTKKVLPAVKKQVLIQSTTLPSFATCIALSKQYYSKGRYEEALKWAKNANIQNKKSADSWIMSAKSLYALGHKEKAVEILEIYYNYHKDDKIKELLREYNETVK